MPALVVLGRQLRLGSDDLAVPSTFGAFWTGAWASVVAVHFTFTTRYLSHACPYRVKHMVFLATLLGLLILIAIVHVAIIWESTKGTIFQVSRRRLVGPLLLALMCFYLAAACSNAYGSHLLMQHRVFSSEAACAAVLPGPLERLHHTSLLKAIVVASWVQLFLSVLCSVVVFRLLPTCSSASCLARRLHLTLLCCMCCCIEPLPEPDEGRGEERDFGGDGGRHGVGQEDSPVMVMARVLLHAFGGVDMTLTDYVTALTLVGVRHRHTKVAHAYSTAPPPVWLSLPHSAMSPRGSVPLRPPEVMAMQAEARAAPTPGPASWAAGQALAGPAGALAAAELHLSATQPPPRLQPAATELELAVPSSASAVTPQLARIGTIDPPTTSAPAALSTALRPYGTQSLPPLEPKTLHHIHTTRQTPDVEQATSLESDGAGTASRAAPVDSEDSRPSPPLSAPDQPQQEALPRPRSNAHGGALQPAIGLSSATIKVFGRASLPSGDMPALLHPRREWCGQWEASNVSVEVLEEALNYYRFTAAVYGWMMYLYLNRLRVTHCCDLCLGRGCGCCRQSAYFLRSVGPDTGPPEGACTPVKLLEREAITQVAGVPDSDILYVSYANKVGGMLPYYIALDRERRAVVLTVRGSWSADDVITDLLCEPAPLDVPGEPSEDASGRRVLWAHRGILASTRAIGADIAAQGVLTAVLTEWPDAGQEGGGEAVAGWLACLPSERARAVATRLRGQCAGWRLVITGHSLGAGVAALLGLMLQQQFPTLRCWAFSPPGGLMSPKAAELTRKFCVSVVHAKDIIPRLGVATVDQLVQELLTASVHCRLSKAAVLWQLVALGQQPHQSQVFRPEEELCAEQRAALEAYCRRMQEHASRSRFADARSFQPPGHLLYIERHPKRRGHDGSFAVAGLDSDPAGAASLSGGCCGGGVRCSCNVCLLETSAKGARYICRFIRAEDLTAGGVVISRSMLTDHFPDHILWGLEKAYQQVREAAGDPTQTSSLRMPAALPCRTCQHGHSGCTSSVMPLPCTPNAPVTSVTSLPTGPAAAQPEAEAAVASREAAPNSTAPTADGATVAQAAAAQLRGEPSEARAAAPVVGSGAVASAAAVAAAVASEPAAERDASAAPAAPAGKRPFGQELGAAAKLANKHGDAGAANAGRIVVATSDGELPLASPASADLVGAEMGR